MCQDIATRGTREGYFSALYYNGYTYTYNANASILVRPVFLPCKDIATRSDNIPGCFATLHSTGRALIEHPVRIDGAALVRPVYKSIYLYKKHIL